jgi:hypothetical protein
MNTVNSKPILDRSVRQEPASRRNPETAGRTSRKRFSTAEKATYNSCQHLVSGRRPLIPRGFNELD